jgi:hypothetical protein
MIKSDRTELGDMEDRIVSLNSVLSKEFKETFMSKRTNTDAGEDDTNSPKRAHTSHGGQRDNTGNVLRRGDHVYDDRQVVDAFTKAGYALESDDEDEDGWAPLNQVKQTGTPSVDLD